MRSSREGNWSWCSAVSAVLLVVASATVVLGQVGTYDDATCIEIDPAQMGVDPKLEKSYLRFPAKVLAIVGPDEMIIRGNDRMPLRLSDALIQADEMGRLHEKDNIYVYGHIGSVKGRPGKFFIVQKLVHRGDDVTLYKDEIQKLDKAGDMKALLDLGRKIEAEGTALKLQQQYQPVAKEAFKLAIAIGEKSIQPDNPKWIELGAVILTYLGDRQGALDHLLRSIKPGEPPAPPQEKLLDDLRAVHYGGRWVLFEEMKRLEGFVERNGKWVLKERADFDDAIAAQRASRQKPRTSLDDFYAALARDGKIETGMNKGEVAQALGFPDDVDRQRIGGDMYDAWRYEGRGSLFFENGLLFRKPDAPR